MSAAHCPLCGAPGYDGEACLNCNYERVREVWVRETPFSTEVRYVDLDNPDYKGITDLFYRLGFGKDGEVVE